jgi:hypothetical protein
MRAGGRSGDLPVQPRLEKHCRFLLTQIIGLSHAIPSRERGVGHRHERWGGMRWTRQRRRVRRVQGGLSIERMPVSIHPARGRTTLLPPSLKPRWMCTRHRVPFGESGSRTAKPCGPGARCWRQVGGGDVSPTGSDKTFNPSMTVTRRIRRRGEYGISR